MDRDALLLLLVGGVLLNFGLLALVALMRAAPWRMPAQERATTARSESAIPLGRAPQDLRQGSPAATPTGVPRLPDVPASAVADATTVSATAAVPAVPAATAVVAAERSPRPAPTARPVRRPRRFTMPDLEEDQERAARSIAAFLGEPVASSGAARPHRRRHRVRRAAGSTPRTALILAIAGDPLPGRAPHAVAAALRDTVRESDEVVEVPGGRLRVTLDADAAGSEAFVNRAQGVVRPWLELLGPNLELRVEDPSARPPAASAAS